MRSNEFFCVKCRNIVRKPPSEICSARIKNVKRVDGVPVLYSFCKICNTNLVKFVKETNLEKFKRCRIY